MWVRLLPTVFSKHCCV